MPSILQLKPMTYADIGETLFLGGTDIVAGTATYFETRSGDITITFSGRGFTYDDQGKITGGILDEYRVYSGNIDIGGALVIVDSNYTLLTGAELATAFAAFAGGDTAGAVTQVMDSWTAEYFSHTNYSGGFMQGYGGGDGLFGSGTLADTIYGRDGDDTIVLNWGDDFGSGDAGNDFLYGGDGNDGLRGGTGNDQMYGDQDNDTMHGGDGNDGLRGGKGDDQLNGGQGNDYLGGDHGNDVLNGGDGSDRLDGGAGHDLLRGGAGADSLSGGGGDDTLFGGSGDDDLVGKWGNDWLGGGGGNDRLLGKTGEDTLIAHWGADTLTGGAGADWFIIEISAGSAHLITDFRDDIDTLDLCAFGFADLAAVLSAGHNTGTGDVVFDLGSGLSLTLENIRLMQLSDDLLF
jgi:Ca2+-binding RTX toxin-like protein